MSETTELRGQVARIVDPEAWRLRDIEPSIPKHKNKGPEVMDWERYRELGCQPSLAKADDILALVTQFLGKEGGSSSAATETSGKPLTEAQHPAGKNLLAECDHLYVYDAWECTCPDLGTLCEDGGLDEQYDGEITKIGRLKDLPAAYAVNLPDGEIDEDGDCHWWEVALFATEAEAAAAYKAKRFPAENSASLSAEGRASVAAHDAPTNTLHPTSGEGEQPDDIVCWRCGRDAHWDGERFVCTGFGCGIDIQPNQPGEKT